MSSPRFAFLTWALGLSLLAGCPEDPGSIVCPGTGILCPVDTFCGAVQPVCLATKCGDGIVDSNEQCDDGNIVEGDSCSPLCKREECGNDVVDPDEICDDGNTNNGDGCNSTCTSRETCGNNIVDVGEVCDDGNAINGDGCSGTPKLVGSEMSPGACKSKEVCGNNIKDVQVGEVCDDGNTVSGDGCNSDCRSGEGCHNGVLDPGEECDDANAIDTDFCVECAIARCGDGKVFMNVEECDGGANCSGDCKLLVCGNGIIDPGEDCDDDNLVSGDGCSGSGHPLLAPCHFEFCGDKLKGASEACDYTDLAVGVMGNPACNTDCTNGSCGDGKHSENEQCDFGVNNGGTSGCAAGTCTLEHCGDGNADLGEQCDNGAANSPNGPCLPTCRSAICGDGVVQSNSTTGTVPGGAESCDLGLANGATTCAYGQVSCTACSATTCQPVTINAAGSTRFCGDGTIDNQNGDPEICDNGTTGTAMFPANGTSTCPYNTSCTTCQANCTGPMMPTPPRCGDGTVDGPNEKCDLGAGNDTSQRPASCPYNTTCTACPLGCATPPITISGGFCGDAATNGTEACDNGTSNTTDVDCPWALTMGASTCTRCSTTCTNLATVAHFCGDGQCDLGHETTANCTADCGTGLFPLTVVKTGGGTGTVTSAPAGISCVGAACTQASANFASGTMVTLTATPLGGSSFVGWGGACTGTTSTCTVTVNQALTANANFAKVVVQRNVTVTEAGTGAAQGTLTIIPGGGAACGANCTQYDDGTVIVITATPGANNSVSWTGCDSTAGDVCIVTANGTENVVATFTLAKFTVDVTIVGTGTVTSSPAGINCTTGTCSAMFDANTTVTLSQTTSGAFTSWTGDCTGAGACSLATITANQAVTATFTP